MYSEGVLGTAGREWTIFCCGTSEAGNRYKEAKWNADWAVAEAK